MSFQDKVISDLKEKGLADSSIALYVRALQKLNGDKPLANLSFLSKMENVMEQIAKYKPNTQRSVLISIVSVLNSVKGLPKTVSKTTNKYYEILKTIKRKADQEMAENSKTESQKENWLSWDEVEGKMQALVKNATDDGKSVSSMNKLIDALVLGLYVYMKPRRNKDYIDMVVVQSDDNVPPGVGDANLLVLKKREFVFKNYKTASTYGEQRFPIPNELFDIIVRYLSARDVLNKLEPRVVKQGKLSERLKVPKTVPANVSVPFLVQANGKPFNQNGVTRILNRIFGGRVGSSMLRHIYLSGKYGNILEEQKKDAEAMAHSVNTQKDYIKTD
jgi:hypothetical protein